MKMDYVDASCNGFKRRLEGIIASERGLSNNLEQSTLLSNVQSFVLSARVAHEAPSVEVSFPICSAFRPNKYTFDLTHINLKASRPGAGTSLTGKIFILFKYPVEDFGMIILGLKQLRVLQKSPFRAC